MTNVSQHQGTRDKLLILAAICLSALVLPLSFTGGAVATPLIFRLFAQLTRWFSYQPFPESHYRGTGQLKRTRF